MNKVLFFIAVVLLVFSSCTKETIPDVSDQYVGNYITFQTRTYTNPYNSQTTIDTASAYSVSISKTGVTTVNLVNFGNCGTAPISANASAQSLVPTDTVCHNNVLITKTALGFSYSFENEQTVYDPNFTWINSTVTATVAGTATKQ